MGRARQQGFLLVGVLLAIMITTIALLALAPVFTQATKVDSSAADYTVATNLAQKQLELLKLKDVQYWQAHCPDANIPWQDAMETLPIVINHLSYIITTQSTVCPEDNRLAQVVVSVAWQRQGNSMSSNVQLTAFYSTIR